MVVSNVSGARQEQIHGVGMRQVSQQNCRRLTVSSRIAGPAVLSMVLIEEPVGSWFTSARLRPVHDVVMNQEICVKKLYGHLDRQRSIVISTGGSVGKMYQRRAKPLAASGDKSLERVTNLTRCRPYQIGGGSLLGQISVQLGQKSRLKSAQNNWKTRRHLVTAFAVGLTRH
jgi:hypothetical protein